MRLIARHVIFILTCSGPLPFPASAADAILPQGDPRLQGHDVAEQDQREEIRKSRLKQQGQGENYRIEGELQGGTSRSTTDASSSPGRQDTGLADPSVNPGQASGMKNIRGQIIKSEEKTHRIRQRTGEETVLSVDDYTRGDTDLHPGDVITSTVTRQGRAVIVQKEPPAER